MKKLTKTFGITKMIRPAIVYSRDYSTLRISERLSFGEAIHLAIGLSILNLALNMVGV